MIEAYVLLQTESGSSSEVAASLRALAGVLAADAVGGPYDVIARVRGRSVDDLCPLVSGTMADVPGVSRALTCTIMEP